MDNIKRLRKPFGVILLIVVVAWGIAASWLPVQYGPVVAASVSDDGRYAITSHRDNKLVLWDLEQHSHDVLAENANTYSAYFVPGREAFIWQDLSNVVRVQSVDGTVIKQFQNFATYGQVIDHSLTHYLSADDHWNIYSGAGEHQTPVLNDGISPSFVGTGKLLNLAMARDRLVFVTAGSNSDEAPITDYAPIDPDRRFSRYSGVTLWNLDTLKPIAKLPGNSAKTDATISPDGQWVVSGDENGIGLFWNTNQPGRRRRLATHNFGIYLDDAPYEPGDLRKWDKSHLIKAPPGTTDITLAVAFIDHSRYFLRFGNNSHQAALFKAGNPWPQKYFDLGESPQLVTYGSQYSRNTAIATSPKAGVLVMGHRYGGGISVYRFDADTLTLERTWVVR